MAAVTNFLTLSRSRSSIVVNLLQNSKSQVPSHAHLVGKIATGLAAAPILVDGGGDFVLRDTEVG